MRVKHVAALAHLEAEFFRPASFGFRARAPRFFTSSVPWVKAESGARGGGGVIKISLSWSFDY